MYIPPELTDIIIQNCATFSPGSAPTDKSTLLTCSLVCRNWVPASRSCGFFRIALNCATDDLQTFAELIDSPRCTFVKNVQEIKFTIPNTNTKICRTGTQHLMKISTLLRPKSVAIHGGEMELPEQTSQIDSLPKPILLREHIRLAFTEAFPSTTHTSLTNLTLTSLLFESFSDLTFLLRSFPNVTSLRLHNLSFVLFNLSPHPPLQQLERLDLRGNHAIMLTLAWLISFPATSTSPVRELRLGDVSQARELFSLVKYLAVSQSMVECVEIGFRKGTEADGEELLNEILQEKGEDLVRIPRISIPIEGSRTELDTDAK